ncbi:MAG: hypothetical protein A4E65_03378 [Syntrophorhabdus sp. PtaU1.Bin153]|nr:MAG: hypothetical protein A4E65_03378 [Syntrophorhabdus sp. PtaU1.Bin153]
MHRDKKIGILYIIVGIFIPLMALPFVSGYSSDKGFMHNFYNVGVKISNENQATPAADQSPATPAKQSRKKITYRSFIPKLIPLRWFLAVTAIFFYMGIIRIDRSRHATTQDKAITGPPR